MLYVVPSDGDLEETCADVSFFLAALEGFRDDSATLQDTGGLRSDLFAYLRSIAIKLSVPRG